MNKRQKKKQLKAINVSLYEVAKNPREAIWKASALIASAYKSSDDPLTKLIAEIEVDRLKKLFEEG